MLSAETAAHSATLCGAERPPADQREGPALQLAPGCCPPVQANPFGEAEAPAPKFGLVPSGEAAKPRLRYQGNGVTSYAEAPIASTGAVGFSCGFGYVGPAFQAAYVGVGSAFFLNSAACGRCLKVSRLGPESSPASELPKRWACPCKAPARVCSPRRSSATMPPARSPASPSRQ